MLIVFFLLNSVSILDVVVNCIEIFHFFYSGVTCLGPHQRMYIIL